MTPVKTHTQKTNRFFMWDEMRWDKKNVPLTAEKHMQ